MSSRTESLQTTVEAAGAVVWRERDERLEVALVHRPRYRDWSWPKGKLDPDESPPAAAVREVAEEIGEPVVLGVPLPGLHYRTVDGRLKHVHYWAAQVAPEGSAALAARAPVVPAGLEEIDEVVWVGAATAAEMLTRRTDHGPLATLQELWRRKRLDTRTLVIARHGRARQRKAWPGEEEVRPLTGQGRWQAERLVPILAAYGVQDVVSSPWERCADTVLPYAQRLGVGLRTQDALTVKAHEGDPAAAAEVVAAYLTSPRDTVICTHRPVLATVMSTIEEWTRRWTIGTVPAKDPYLRTGEVLVVHVVGQGSAARVAGLDRHRASARPAV